MADNRLFCVPNFRGRGRSGLFNVFPWPNIPVLILRPNDMVSFTICLQFSKIQFWMFSRCEVCRSAPGSDYIWIRAKIVLSLSGFPPRKLVLLILRYDIVTINKYFWGMKIIMIKLFILKLSCITKRIYTLSRIYKKMIEILNTSKPTFRNLKNPRSLFHKISFVVTIA